MAPKIIIDIWTRMHPQAMRQAEQQLVNQFRKIGKEGSNALSDEFIKQTPKMQRALKKVADETANASKKERDLATDRTARANATERAAQLEDRIREKSAAHNRVIAESAVLEKELKQVRAEHGQITRGIETREKNLHDRRVELNAKTRELGLAEIDLRNARDRGDDAAVLALEEHLHQQRDEQSKMLANIVRKETDLQRQRDTLGGVTNRLTGLEYQLDDAQTKRHETLVDLKAAENDYTQAKRESVGVDQEAIRRSDEVS